MKSLKLYGKGCIHAYSGDRIHNHYENKSRRGGEKQRMLDYILDLLTDWRKNMRVVAEADITLGFSI